MQINIITIFPELFENFLNTSIIKKAQEKQKVKFEIYNLRDFCTDKNKMTDDEPYGGGRGMVMKPEPIFAAIRNIKQNFSQKVYVILLTPQGKILDQKKIKNFAKKADSKFKTLILVCGRYEGFDERIMSIVDEEISIGNFVLNGGEIPAMVLSEAIVRLIPGVLGSQESFENDSFYNGKYLDYPHYTRPADFEGMKVPSVLLNGNHKEIEKWRHEKSILNTYKKRPDLLTKKQIKEIESNKELVNG